MRSVGQLGCERERGRKRNGVEQDVEDKVWVDKEVVRVGGQGKVSYGVSPTNLPNRATCHVESITIHA
jgi:hypothetical protein